MRQQDCDVYIYQVIQCDHFIPQLEVTNNLKKGSRENTIPKRSPAELPGIDIDRYMYPISLYRTLNQDLVELHPI